MSFTPSAQPRFRRLFGTKLISTFLGLAAIAALIGNSGTAHGQTNTYTDQSSRRFTNVTPWNFGAGYSVPNPVPFSSATGILSFQAFGTNGPQPANDLNLTLNTIKFFSYTPTNNIGLTNTIAGTYTFAGTGTIQLNGSGGNSGGGNFGANMVVGFVMGSTATSVTLNSAGDSNQVGVLNTNISGAGISSNTFAGAPLVINTGGLANTGVVTMNSANTFAGGVTLTSGNMNLANAGAIGILGNQISTLTINSTTSGAATISQQNAVTIINPIVTTAGGGDLVLTGGRGNEGAALTLGGFLANGVSGPGNVIVRPANSQADNFAGINTYTGATTIGQIQYATNGSPTNPGTMRLNGALGQLTATSGISINDGAVLELNDNGGNSVNNSRISPTVPISMTNGYLQVINGSGGVVTQNVGTVTGTGLDVILANASSANSSTTVNINNLVRGAHGTFLFTGGSGSAAVGLGMQATGPGIQQGNIVLNNLNGVSTSTAAGLTAGGFVGGGFYPSVPGGLLTSPATNLSILPYALGTTSNTGNLIDPGTSALTGFVTYGASTGNFGLRPLAANEYNTGNFATTPAVNDNMMIGASAALATPTTVNSVFFGAAGSTISGSALTVTSGAIASGSGTTTAAISSPVVVPGEAVVSVVGALNTTNTLTLSGGITAAGLTKAGYGILSLATTGSAIAGPITVNAGALQIANSSALGGATSLVFNMNDYGGTTTTTTLPGGLIYTGAAADAITQPIAINAGRANIRMAAAGTLTIGAGGISGNGGLNIDPVVAGSTIILTGTNTLAGGLRLASGGGTVQSLVQFGSDANLGAASAPMVLNGAGYTMQTTGAWTTTRQISLEGTFGSGGTAGSEGFDTAGHNASWGGQILGGGNGTAFLVKIDSAATPGVWTITSANNPFSGTIQLGSNFHQGGTLALTTGDINSGSIQFGNGATSVPGTYKLDLSGAGASGNFWRSFLSVGTAAGFTQPHSILLGLDGVDNTDIRVGNGSLGTASSIQGFGSFIVTGGTVTLNSTVANASVSAAGALNSYLNTTTGNSIEVWGGTLQVGLDSQMGDPTGSVGMKTGRFQNVADITTSRNFSLAANSPTLVGDGPNISFNNGDSAAVQNAHTLTITGNVTGAGGFEKTGYGTLYFKGTNTFGGNIATNAGLRAPYTGFAKIDQGNWEFDSDANLGNATTKIVLLSLGSNNGLNDLVGGTLELSPGQGTAAAPVVINRFVALQSAGNNRAGIQVDAGSFLQYSGTLVSPSNTTQVFLKRGAGTLVFDANASQYVSTIEVGDGVNASGPLVLTSNAQIPRVNLYLAVGSAATLDLSGTGSGLAVNAGNFASATGTNLALGTGGSLTYGWNAGNQGQNNGVTNNTAAGYIGPNGQVNTTVVVSQSGPIIAGTISGGATATLAQVGTTFYQLQSDNRASGWGGSYNLMFGGGLAINSNGALPLLSNLTIGAWGSGAVRGPILSLDDSVVNTIPRLNAAQVVYSNSGELSLTGNAAGSAETFGALFGGGYTLVTAGTTTAGGSITASNASTGLSRVNNGTFLFRSAATGTLGSAAAGANQANIFFGNIGAGNLIGGGGAQGTTTVSILPFAIGDNTSGGIGSTLVTYGANGIRTLAAAEYQPSLLAAGATENVQVSNSALTTTTLVGNQTINALVISGGAGAVPSTTLINGSQNLTVTSGTILNTVSNVYANTSPTGTALGIQVSQLSTAGQQLNVFAAGDLAIGAQITTTAGLVKSGFGGLLLTNSANTYTGGTTITGGSLIVDSLGAINDGAANTLTLDGGEFKYRGAPATLASSVLLGGGSATNPGMGGGFNVSSGTTLTLPSGGVSGLGGINKDGTGVLVLQGTNTFSGPVILQGGALAFDGAAALGTSPRLLVSDTALAVGSSFRFLNSTTLTQEIDIISGNPAAGNAGIGLGIDSNGNNVVLSGVINSPNNNGKGLYKLGAGDLRLTAANLYTGATQVFGGTLTLGGANGSILNSGIGGAANAFNTADSTLVNFGAGLILDNTGTANNNRLPSGWSTAMSNGDSSTNGGIRLQGGNFTLRGNSTTAVTEYAGRMDVFVGTITLENNGRATVLTTGRVNRVAAPAMALVRGERLGSGAPAINNTNWYSVDEGSGSTQLNGAGGAKGTPYINIVPGFIGDASQVVAGANTTTGTDLMTYSSDVGFRILSASEYKANAFDGSFTTPNFDISRAPNVVINAAGTSSPSFTTWVNAIKMSGAGTTLSGTGTLNLMASTILATGGGSQSITVPNISINGTGNNGGYEFFTAGTTSLTVNANLSANTVMVYGGANGNGQLNLAGAYYGNGQVFVGQGSTLNLTGANAFLNPIASNVNVAVGGTLSLGGFDRTIGAINTQSLIGTFNLNQVSDGTIALGANKLTLYDNQNSVFTGQITGSAGSTVTQGLFAASTTTVTQPQPNFSGSLRINNGTFQLASSGTLPNVSAIDIRGGTLLLNNSDDNASAGQVIAQRIPATVPINLAGNLNFNGNPNVSASVLPNTALGTVTLVGGGTVTVPDGVTIANLARAANRGTLVVSSPAVAISNFDAGTGTAGAGWTANVASGSGAGTASFINATTAQLTPAVNSSAGSIWYNNPVSTRPFTLKFTYTNLTGSAGNPADGMTFGFQSVGLNALGGGGGSLGIQGVSPSAVGQLNIFGSNTFGGGNGASGVSTLTNGAGPPQVASSAPVVAGTNTPVNFVVNYDGTNMTITMTQGTATYTQTSPLNLGVVGSSAFFGFTGATGGLNAQQQISNFSFVSTGSALGLPVSPNGGARLSLSQIDGAAATAALSGGGGAAGTTTVSILPWGWSSVPQQAGGTLSGSFLTYDPVLGIRPLNATAGPGTEYVTSLAAPGVFDNVRTAAAQVLAAPTEINSLISTAGNISGAFDLTLRSGALAVTGAATIGVNTNNLKTGIGGANTSELVVFNTAATTVNYNIGTSGGLTKFGGGTLTLGGTNTFSGGLTVNGGAVAFSSDNAVTSNLGSASNTVTFGIPTNNVSPNGVGLQYTGTVLATPAITRNFVTNSFGGIIGPVNQVTTLNNTISGTGAFAYNGPTAGAIYEVNGNNTYTGDTYLPNGQISIGGATPDAAFGGNPTSVIQLNTGGAGDGIDLRSNWTTSHTLQMRTVTTIDTNGFTATINSPIIGTAQLTKNNLGTLILTAPNSFTGAVSINAGTVVLTGRGAVNVAPGLGFGTTLVLDDNGQGAGGAAAHYSDRIPDNAGTITGNYSDLQLIGNNTVPTEEVIGSLTLGFASKITVQSNGQPTILRLGQGATFTRSASGSVLFRGTNLGTAAPGTPGVANIMIFNPLGSGGALTGGGGPANNTAISIVPGSFGDTNAFGNGTQLVTYDLNNGIRLLNPLTEYATALNNGTAMVDNIHLTASNTGIANATAVNALWLENTGGPVTVSGGGLLTITAGNILVTGTGHTISTPLTTGGSNAIAVGGPGDLTIGTAITATTTGGLIKTGDGNLTLSADNLYTGTTSLSAGTLTLNSPAAIPAASTLRITGGTLAAGSPGLTLTLTNAVGVGLDGDLTFGGNNDLTIAGLVNLDSGQRNINVATGRTLTLSGVLAASSSAIAGNGITLNGGGTLVLAGNNTYGVGSGSAAGPGFYLTQTVVNAGALQVNGQTGVNSGTGGSTVVVNNTGTVLGGTGQIIPNQQLMARNTVTVNSGAVLSPGLNTPNPNGTLTPGVLTVGSATTPGVTQATVTETAGSYFRFLYTSSPAPVTAPVDSGASETPGAAGNNEVLVHGALVLAGGLDNPNPSQTTDFRILGNVADFPQATVLGNSYSFQIAQADAGATPYEIKYSQTPNDFDVSGFTGFTGQFDIQVHTTASGAEFVNFTPVPEPSTLLATGAAAIGLFGAIRRRRKAAAAKTTA